MTGRPDTFMPFYIADYLGDTGHLSTLEHGAYLLLLFHYWRTGRALLDDPEHLRKIARMSATEWVTVSAPIRSLFRFAILDAQPVLVHKRMEEELAHAVSRYGRAKAASTAANKAKSAAAVRIAARSAHKAVPGPDTDTVTGSVTETVTQPQPQPHYEKEDESLRDSRPEVRVAASKPEAGALLPEKPVEFETPAFLRRGPPDPVAEPPATPPLPPAVPEAPAKVPAVIDPAWIEIPTASWDTKQESFPVPESKIEEWQASYPGVDVRQQLRAMRQWSFDNRAKRKTKTGMLKFINGWLAREQDNPKGERKNVESFGSAKNSRFLTGLASAARRFGDDGDKN